MHVLDIIEDYDLYIARAQAGAVKTRHDQTTVIAVITSLVCAVLCLGVLTWFPYGFSSNSVETAINWSDQDYVPLASWDHEVTERSDEVATTVDRLFQEYLVHKEASQVSVMIPVSQRVVVVGRRGVDSILPYELAFADSGSYTQTCVIERGASLILIGYDSGRALFGYAKPDFTAVSSGDVCTSVEIFFEKLG